jgi:pimeloyl-ACP methyl ester carboxylesterase
MFKTTFISLTMTAACAMGDKPVAPGEGAKGEDRKGTSLKAQANESVTFAQSNDGTKIAFEKAGKGPAVVIVGGALSRREDGAPLVEKLADRFTVYTYDRRGRGESGDTKPYAVEREIEDLGALIEQAGGSAYVYGVSSGAALSLQGAERLGPTKVLKLALYEPPYGQKERDFNEQKLRVDQLVQTGEPGDAAAYFFTAIGTPPQAVEDMKRSPKWEGIRKVDHTLAYDYAVLGNGSVPDSVKSITVPTLVMHGEKSMGFMAPTAERIAELMPNARRKAIEGQAHQAAPEAVAPLLVEFFELGS